MLTLENVKSGFGNFLGPKITPTNWIKSSKFSGKLTEDFRQLPNFTMRESDFNQFMRLRAQLVTAVGKFGREQTLFPIQMPKMSKDTHEQHKLTHRVVDVVDRPNRKICGLCCVTMWTKQASLCTQVRLFARKKE